MLHTARLTIEPLTLDDTRFILALPASLGFGHERMVRLTPDAVELCLYGWQASEPVA